LFGVAVVLREPFAEIARNFAVHGLQIDDLIALDNAKMRAFLPFERNDFHAFQSFKRSENASRAAGLYRAGLRQSTRTRLSRG
jgi:hypothetical protein